MAKQALNEAEQPAYFPHREASETAASAHNRLYPPSGVIRYTVVLATAVGRTGTVVEASTGDEAAEKALAKFPGAKVAYVGPAGDEMRLSDEVAE